MTGAELLKARKRLKLSAAELGRLLELEGRDPGLAVRRWETDAHPIPGPVRVALRYLLADLTLAKKKQADLAKVSEAPGPEVPEAPALRVRRRGPSL